MGSFGRVSFVVMSLLICSRYTLGKPLLNFEGNTNPESLPFFNEPMVLNGQATHRRFIFDIYSLKLFLNFPARTPEEIFAQPVKIVIMEFKRSLSAQTLRAAFAGAVAANCAMNGLCATIERALNSFLNEIPDVQSGDTFIFTLNPEESLIQMKNSPKLLRVGDKNFGEALLLTWIGPAPPSEEFKRKILGN